VRGTGWCSGDHHTIPGMLLARLETDPDAEYLDVNGVAVGHGGGSIPGVTVPRRADVLGADGAEVDAGARPSDLGTFVYTGAPTGPSKGCLKITDEPAITYKKC
jgi:hypothetical protein